MDVMDVMNKLVIIDWEKAYLLVDKDEKLLKYIFYQLLYELENSMIDLEIHLLRKEYYRMFVLISQLKGSVICYHCTEFKIFFLKLYDVVKDAKKNPLLTFEKVEDLTDLFRLCCIAFKRLLKEVEYHFYKTSC
jgi:hypothetical protein